MGQEKIRTRQTQQGILIIAYDDNKYTFGNRFVM